MFSSQRNPLSRNIPRIFLFDCCDGVEDQKAVTATATASPKHVPVPSAEALTPDTTEEKAAADALELSSGKGSLRQTGHSIMASTDWLWKHGEANPDHRLAVLNAAN